MSSEESHDLSASFDGEAADSIEAALIGREHVALSVAPGEILGGRYTLEERLGRGGMGEVWRARHTTTQGMVAVKVMTASGEQSSRRFELEARNASALSHPHTVRVLDYGVDTRDGMSLPYLVMEHLEGRSLEQVLRTGGAMPWQRVVVLAAQVLSALQAAHTHPKRIVHRDIKPENLFLCETGDDTDFVKVVDFGISRALDASHADTRGLIGSPYHMAPEQWGMQAIGPRTDLYALGCTVYALLTGRPPYMAEALADLRAHHEQGNAAPVSDLMPAIPRALSNWVRRMMATNPEDRPADAHEAMQTLAWLTNPRVTVTEEHLLAHALPPDPFRYLRRFEREHAPVFFGRARLIQRLCQEVLGARDIDDGLRLILVYGPTGVGKSSLLEAGLLPRLEATCDVGVIRRSAATMVSQQLRDHLEATDDRSLADAWQARTAELEQDVVVVLDQLEEIYTRPLDVETTDDHKTTAETEVVRLFEQLRLLFEELQGVGRGTIILSFRKEWLAEFETALVAAGLPAVSIYVEPLDRFEVIEAVEGITQHEALRAQYPLSIESGVSHRIADILSRDHRGAIAPTLQILLSKMWQKAATPPDTVQSGTTHKRVWSMALLEELEADGLFLSDFLDEQFATISAWNRECVESGLLLDLLANHTTELGTGTGRSAAEIWALYGHRSNILESLLERCVDTYLLRGRASMQGDTPRGSLNLAHDTLAPLIRDRHATSNLAGQRAARILEPRAIEWEGGHTVSVLDEHDLELVEAGQPGMRQWREVERQMVVASRQHRTRRQARRRMLLVGATVAVMLVAVAAVVAWWQRGEAREAQTTAQALAASEGEMRGRAEASEQEAKRQLHISTTQLLISQFEAAAAESPVTAALIAVQAYHRVQDVPESTALTQIDAALRKSLETDFLVEQMNDHTNSVIDVSYDPQGAFLATFTHDGQARIWDQAKRSAPVILEADKVPLVAGVLTAKHVVTANKNGVIRIYSREDLDAAPLVRTMPVPSGQVLRTVAFDDTLLAASVLRGKSYVWTRGVETPVELSCGTAGGAVVALSSAGLAMADSTGQVCIWARTSLETQSLVAEPLTIKAHETPVFRMAWSPDGKQLATGAVNDPVVRLWDVRATEVTEASALEGAEAMPLGLAFHPTDPMFYSCDDGRVYAWALNDTARGPRIMGHTRCRQLDISSDGARLAAASDANRAVIWFLDRTDPHTVTNLGHWIAVSPDEEKVMILTPESLHHLTLETRHLEHVASFPAPLRQVAWSPDGAWISATGEDNNLNLLQNDGEQWKIVRQVPIGTRGNGLSFSADNRIAAVTTYDGSLNLTRLDTDGPLETVKLFLQSHDVQFSSDGQWMAAGGDVSVVVWDRDAIDTYLETGSLPAHTHRFDDLGEEVLKVEFGPEHLFAGTSFGSVFYWRLDALEAPPDRLDAHRHGTWGVDLDDAGQTLVTSGDHTIRVWRRTTDDDEPWRLERTLMTFDTSGVLALYLRDDGSILTTDRVSRIRYWGETAALESQVCSRVYRNFTQKEWQQYMGDVPYERTCPNLPAHP